MVGLLMAVNCATGPCLQVYTDPLTNQLIITANQHAPGTIVAPKPRPKRIYVPRPKPKPTTWIPYKPRPTIHSTYRAPVKKKPSTVIKVASAAISLSDQITKLLPGSQLLYQPTNNPVSGIPIYFWSDSNPVFQVVTAILGIGVSVALQPTFVWDFGDGATFTTSNAGGPFPNATVTHIYKTPGNYSVRLTISWAGSWAAQGQVLPVLGGAIVQTVTTTILVAPGPTNYTH